MLPCRSRIDHSIHPHFKKAHGALLGKAETSTHLKKTKPGPTTKQALADEADRQKLVHDYEWVQRGATFIQFAFWTIGCAAIYGNASARFLLQGNDPWTFGQVSCLSIGA